MADQAPPPPASPLTELLREYDENAAMAQEMLPGEAKISLWRRRREIEATAFPKLRAALEALRAQLATAQQDSERMDELERMALERGGLLLHDGTELGRNGLGLFMLPTGVRRSLRGAVDAARRPHETQEGDRGNPS